MKRITTFICLLNIFLTNHELKSQCSTPTLVNASPAIICSGSTTSLSASSSNSTINWYTVSVSGTTVGTSLSGANFIVSPTVNTTYYAESFSDPTTFTLNYTGGIQTYTVPAGVTTLTVDLMGAKGGSGYPSVSAGGNGGRVTGTISVTPGQVLQIYVGGMGGDASASLAGSAGFNGGGIGALYSGAYGGGGGGGATDIRVPPYSLSDRIAIAGGGGGGAYNASTTNYDKGGYGNGPTGEAGYSNNVSATGAGGYGGSQTSGGNGGFWSGYCTASSGSLGVGGNGGSCSNSGGGGGGGYYGGGGGVWAGGGGGSSFLVNGNFTGGFQTGNGMVIITTPGCTSLRAEITVTVNVNPTISVNNGTICAGQSFTITPSGAASYTFEGGSDIVSPTSNSSYTINGTSAQGCVSQNIATVSVTVNSNPTIAVNNGTLCEGTSYTITPTGADTYVFEGGNAVVSPSINTTYTVVGTNTVTGCVSQIASASLTVSPAPIITVNNGTICAGQSFTMAPSGASTYTYSNGTDVVTPTADASYTVTGTDINGCENMTVSSVTVNTLPSLTATTNNTLLCTGATATLSVSGATTFTWSTNENTSSVAVSPTVQTTYTVNGTDANGCVSTTTVTQDVSLCTGIVSLSNVESIKVYPNPNNGLFVLELVSASKVTVTNALGQVIISETFEAGKHSVDLHNETNGIYFIKLIANNQQQIIKVIKE